jgi:hypothetical protein
LALLQQIDEGSTARCAHSFGSHGSSIANAKHAVVPPGQRPAAKVRNHRCAGPSFVLLGLALPFTQPSSPLLCLARPLLLFLLLAVAVVVVVVSRLLASGADVGQLQASHSQHQKHDD